MKISEVVSKAKEVFETVEGLGQFLVFVLAVFGATTVLGYVLDWLSFIGIS